MISGAWPGFYFVTICATRRLCLFGDISDEKMHLNRRGEIVAACWEDLPNHHPHVQQDAFVVMPNHVHGIIALAAEDEGTAGRAPTADETRAVRNTVGSTPTTVGTREGTAGRAPTAEGARACADTPGPALTVEAFRQPVAGSLATIIRSFKAAAARCVNETVGRAGTPLWQPNYYEHVIRDEAGLDRIRDYIATNVERWSLDAENPLRKGQDEFDRWLSSLPSPGASQLGVGGPPANRVAHHG